MAQKKLTFPERLTERYRPETIDAFIGLHKARRIMEAFVKRPYSSAWLFKGDSGLGKTTFGLAVADQINAELHLIPSQKCDVEMVESVTTSCHRGAFNFFGKKSGRAADWHLVLVDEANRMTAAAQLALLSKLDSTAQPPRTVFIFTCNTLQSLEVPFQSRCNPVLFEYETIEGELEHYLRRIYKKEGGTYRIDFAKIAKESKYNVRDAINKLELELLLGADRDDLPKEREMSPVEEHTHNCKKCHKGWKHGDPLCEMPFRSDCETCGGGEKTAGQVRAGKAWDTIRNKIAAKVRAEDQANGGKKKLIRSI